MSTRRCQYCNFGLDFSSEYYILRKATKPKGSPDRWTNVGFVCMDCCAIGMSLQIEYDPYEKQLKDIQ